MKKRLLIILFTILSTSYAGNANISITFTPQSIDCSSSSNSTATSNFDIVIDGIELYKIYKIEIKDNDTNSQIHTTETKQNEITGSYTYRLSEGEHSIKVIVKYTDGSADTVKTGSVTVTNNNGINCPGG